MYKKIFINWNKIVFLWIVLDCIFTKSRLIPYSNSIYLFSPPWPVRVQSFLALPSYKKPTHPIYNSKKKFFHLKHTSATKTYYYLLCQLAGELRKGTVPKIKHESVLKSSTFIVLQECWVCTKVMISKPTLLMVGSKLRCIRPPQSQSWTNKFFKRSVCAPKHSKKIPHTGDKASLDRCG